MNQISIKKGDVVKSAGSDHTVVLDVQGTDALLFTGTMFIKAHEFEMDDNRIAWSYGNYYESLDQIPKNYGNMEVPDIKNDLATMMKDNDSNTVKALISLENNVLDLGIVDKMYQQFKDDGFNLLNDTFDEIHSELTQGLETLTCEDDDEMEM